MGRKSVSIITATAAAFVLVSSSTSSETSSTLFPAPLLAEARPSCEHCMSTGSPYFCKASITSQICFNGGDAQCDHQFCVCCKNQPQGGCMACEELDEDEWQEENLEQIDAWQSHELRKRVEEEKEDRIAARNEEIGLKEAAITKAKLEKERLEKKKQVEAERAAIEAKKKKEAEEKAEEERMTVAAAAAAAERGAAQEAENAAEAATEEL